MRVHNTPFHSAQALVEDASAHGIEDDPALLILVLTRVDSAERIAGLQAEIGACFPQALLLGATTPGCGSGGICAAQTMVCLCRFEHTRLHLVEVDAEEERSGAAGEQLGDTLSAVGARAALLLATGLSIDGDALARGIEHTARGVPICGGLAGATTPERRPLVFTRDRILRSGAIAAAFVNPQLRVHSHYSLGWVPLGQGLTVSRAERTRLYSIDDTPALEVYRHYLSDAAAEHLYEAGVLFPLMTERHGVLVARACTAADADGSLRLMGALQPGEAVRFGVFDSGTYLEAVNHNLSHLKRFRPEAVFAFPCVTRRLLMPELLDAELAQMHTVAPSSAMLSFGEFFHRRRQNLFFNFTSTVFALAESAPPAAGAVEPVDIAPVFARADLQLQVLSHLVNVTARELEAANSALEVLASTDMLTEAWNRRRMQTLFEEELLRSGRYGEPLAAVLFDIDDFKAVNDRHGHSTGDQVLRQVAEATRGVMRRTDQLGRWGGEEFLVLCIGTDRGGAQELAERLRTAVAERGFADGIRISISLGIAALRSGDSVDSLLRRADEGLYRSKADGKNRATLVD